MVKGCERRVVVYKSNDSKYFCEAYFFIKPSFERHDVKKRELLDEANRIVKESALYGGADRKRRNKMLILYIAILTAVSLLSSGVTLFIASNL